MKAIRFRVDKLKGKRFSDLEDAQGHQYVDLVQEGGGVLGIALVGYTYVLEMAGIRFYSLAGTSAGAINTLMLAGMGNIQEAKSEKILRMLCEKELFDLVDGNKSVRHIIRKAVKKEGGIGWDLLFRGVGIFRTLRDKLGMNPGDNFIQWITHELAREGVNTLSDLTKLREQLPDGLVNVCDGSAIVNKEPRLAIITSDITSHSKIEFPAMAPLYWKDPHRISPALLARASMSIPFFFQPFEVDDVPNAGESGTALWYKHVRYAGRIPEKVKFVDGGMLSNFPINVFHREDRGVPLMPTFGARLSAYREYCSKPDSLLPMIGAMVNTMRQIYDYDFLLKHPDYSQLICRIDADQDFNWLDFDMDDGKKISLFNHGMRKAVEFLEKFEWEGYKKLRAKD